MNRSLFRVSIHGLPPILLLTAASCASSQFIIESDPPGAEILVVSSGGVKQKIGQTPMTVTSAQQPALFSPDAQVQIAKTGFHTESFLLPPGSGGSTGRIQAKLADDAVSKTCQDAGNTLTETTDAVANAQRLIFKKNYGEAERMLNTFTSRFPSVPVFHSLLGNVHYLQKDLDRALAAYQRSNSLQPQNLETSRMIEKIKSIRGTSGGGN